MAPDAEKLKFANCEPKIPFWREWEFLALVVLTTVIYFSRIADFPLRGEETRRAMVALEILRSGDWIVPHQQGELFLSRPPVASWPIAWFTSAFGDLSSLAVRLPTVLATLLTTLLVYAYSRNFLSRLGSLSAGLGFATCIQVLQLGRVAETEATFTLFLAGAMLIWHWGYTNGWPAWRTWCTAYLLLAIATLVKSLQAPVYFCGAVGLFLLWCHDWRYAVTRAHALGLGVFAAVFCAWQVPFYARLGWDATRQIWGSDVALRFVDLSIWGIVQHFATYPLQVWACLLPWALLLPAFFWPEFRRTLGATKPMVAFLAIAWIVALPTCWFVPNARARYIMPLYPMAAPLIGLVVQRIYKAGAMRRIRLGWNWFVGATITATLAGAVAVVAASWIPGIKIPEIAQTPFFAALYLSAAVVLVAILVQNWNRWTVNAATVNVIAISAFLGLTVSGVSINSLNAQDPNMAQQVAALKQRVSTNKPLASFGTIASVFSYHWRDPIVLAGNRVPKTLDEVAPYDLDYFCFGWGSGPQPTLPFPWRVEAIINCDRVVTNTLDRIVIVGKRIDTVTYSPTKLNPVIEPHENSRPQLEVAPAVLDSTGAHRMGSAGSCALH